MGNNTGKVVKSEQIDKLIKAVQEYAHEIQESGRTLKLASELAKNEMQNDDLSKRYTKELDDALQELKPVFKEIENLIEALILEKRQVEKL